MAIKLPSHLHRSRSGTLHFRIAIPRDLRHHFASREIYRSLRTPNVREAASAVQALSAVFKRVFERLRQESMSNKRMPNDGIAKVGLIMELNFDEFMKPKSVKLQTEPHDTPESIRAAVEGLTAAGSGGLSSRAESARKPSLLFSELVQDYRRDRLAKGRWLASSEKEYMPIYKLFIEIVGDLPLSEINDDVALTYVETLKKLPANMNKIPAYRGKTIELVGAMMLEQNDEWSLQRRYMQLEGLLSLSDNQSARLSAVIN